MTTLYRPVGEKEYQLIKKSKFKKFPPRLPEQPIFYPVTTLDYAVQIAKDWNAKHDGKGYVLQFEVKTEYLEQYQEHTVGSCLHREYWIPAEDLENFNKSIIGKIKVIKSFQKWFIYLLECFDKTLYTGITNNLEKRLQQHNKNKGAKYTRGRTPVVLLKTFEVFSKSEALKLEYKIKRMSKDEKLNYQS